MSDLASAKPKTLPPAVLVVSPDATTCDVVSLALEERWPVLAATSVRAAAEMAAVRTPSIVIVDGDLPSVGLDELLVELRRTNPRLQLLTIQPKASDSPVPMLAPVLVRPIHPGQVVEAVIRTLEGSARARDPLDDLLVRVHRSRTTRFER